MMPEARIYVMCGLPRSGKNTWIDDHKADKVVVEAGQLRYLVYGQRFWDEGEALMWSVHDVVLRMLLQQGNLDIIINECNVTVKRRARFISIANEYGYEAICVHVPTSRQECIDRAQKLDDPRIIPVIQRMFNEFQKPTLEEGFSGIIVL